MNRCTLTISLVIAIVGLAFTHSQCCAQGWLDRATGGKVRTPKAIQKFHPPVRFGTTGFQFPSLRPNPPSYLSNEKPNKSSGTKYGDQFSTPSYNTPVPEVVRQQQLKQQQIQRQLELQRLEDQMRQQLRQTQYDHRINSRRLSQMHAGQWNQFQQLNNQQLGQGQFMNAQQWGDFVRGSKNLMEQQMRQVDQQFRNQWQDYDSQFKGIQQIRSQRRK